MALTVTLSSPEASRVKLRIESHSAVNGADFIAGATFAITSNDPAVATVDVSQIPPLAPGVRAFELPVSILAAGSTDITVTETAADGTEFTGADSLVVNPAPAAGQTHIAVALVVSPA